MLNTITRLSATVARVSAHKPIHFTIVTSLLASMAYLAVVDEYIPESFDASEVVFYHPPGSNAYDKWVQIDDASIYPDADQLTLVPLVFNSNFHHEIPEIANAFDEAANERVLVVTTPETEATLAALNKITYDGVTWKARYNNLLGRYYGYAKQAAFKLYSLIQMAESFDIALIVVAYFAMFYTIIKVFIDIKQGGSNFWLAFSTIVSSAFAFIFALATTTKLLDIKVSLISMSEGIPFLTAIIGFKHKISVAKAVMKARSTHTDVRTIVSSAIANHSLSLLRDYVIAISALAAATIYSGDMTGLRNFCVLATIILAYDLLLVYTFFAGVLALKVEVNRARRTHELKSALEEEGVSSLVAETIANSASEDDYPEDAHFNSTVVSFKIALLGIFVAAHAFWLGSSWLYGTPTIDIVSETQTLSLVAAEHVAVGSNGTIVHLLAPKRYVPFGAIVLIEDFVVAIFLTISDAIKDNMLSKFLLFVFAISISINVYFLNATRDQRTATNKLIQKEISRPKHKEADQKIKVTESFESETEDAESSSTEGTINFNAHIKNLTVDECVAKMKDGQVKELNNNEIASLVVAGKLPLYALEKKLESNTRAVVVRRKAIAKLANAPILDTDKLPYAHYDYDRVFGACCENVIGYLPLPVGVAGPLIIDGTPYHIPMATTEGCLVASAMRGCKAINAGGGVLTILTQDGMTRGPCVSFPTLARAGACKIWLDSEEGQKTVKKAFNSTSRFARLQHIKTAMAGTLLFIRFKTTTGDAMGMNMISKGVEHSLKYMTEECGWDDMSVIAVSGNYCTDKKPAAINWIEGRGKSVVAEARIPADVVKLVLKSDVDALVELNISKNLIGSAMAGSVGGFNAHAANLVTAVFLACGQDPAQNVESSNCITLMNKIDGGDLQISVSMPSIEVGTIGGGTILEPQGAMLDLLGVRGPHPTSPGDNSRRLACIVASAVLAAELSLCSALAAGHLVQSHMQHNRKGAAPAVAPAAPAEKEVQRLTEGSVNCIKS